MRLLIAASRILVLFIVISALSASTPQSNAASCLGQLTENTRSIERWLDRPYRGDISHSLSKRWFDIERRSQKVNWLAFRKHAQNPVFLEIQRLRSQGSATIYIQNNALHGISDAFEQALLNWNEAEQKVVEWVEAAQPITFGRLQWINQKIHDHAAPSWITSGALRTYEQKFMGGHVPVSAGDVLPALQRFEVWFQGAEKRLHPIQVAAEAYQRLILIHPFADGNGRSIRLLLDWILQRHGFPPAAFASIDDVNIFRLNHARFELVEPWEIVVKVTDAIENALTLVEGSVNSRHSRQ